jgi:hypothetical protein
MITTFRILVPILRLFRSKKTCHSIFTFIIHVFVNMCKGATVPSRMRPVNHQKPIHASDPFTDGRKNDYFESSIIAKIIWILMRRPETGDGSAISHQPEPTYYPLHVVTEMANLVTDIQFLDINPLLSSSSKGGGNHKNNKSVSPVSSVHDLYAMQTSRRRFTYDLSLLSTWRQQMYSWTRTVVRGLHLDRDTAAVAFSTLDRFLTIKLRDNDEISRENF